MTNNVSNNTTNNNVDETNNMNRTRRGSVGNAVFSNLFQRSSSTSTGSASVLPPAALNINDAAQRRRLSVSTLGIHGTSPTSSNAPYHFRRASTSTNSNHSEAIDECAVEEDDMIYSSSAKTAPSSPFRRMSMGGPPGRGFRNGSIGTGKTRSAIPRTRGTSSLDQTPPSPFHIFTNPPTCD